MSSRLWTATLCCLLAAGCGNSKGGSPKDAGSDGGGGTDAPATDTPAGDTSTSTDTGTDVGGGTPQKLVILHTNDLHSHLMGDAPEADYTPATLNDDMTTGG